MKITNFFLLLVFLAPHFLFSQLKHGNVYDYIYLEKEKKIRSKNNIKECFEFIQQNKSNNGQLYSHTTYNRYGDILTYALFAEENDTVNYEANEYAADKLVKSKNFNNENGILVLIDSSSYIYDKKGNNTDIQISETNGNRIYQKINYNNQNLKKTVYTKWSENSDFILAEEYIYANNHLIQKQLYDRTGKLALEIKFKYDIHGNTIAVYELMDGNKVITYSFSYYKSNNLIKIDKLHCDNNNYRYSFKFKFEYDSNGNIIKKDPIPKKIKTTNLYTYKLFE